MELLFVRILNTYIRKSLSQHSFILNEKEFRGARDEFLEAHKHYLQKDYKAALNDCLKSFESVMISICDERKWNYPKGANAKALIDVCFKNNLIPSHWQSQFSALRSLLESGVPTGRNRISGHGQGTNTYTSARTYCQIHDASNCHGERVSRGCICGNSVPNLTK